VIASHAQRWLAGRAFYRPAREVVDVRSLEVAEIPDDTTARAFVEAHHYSATYPAARFRFGLYARASLVGVIVFSVPMNALTLACLPGAAGDSAELGRLVLLDEVGANAETLLIARCFDMLRREGLVGVVSFSDDVARTDAAGAVTFRGHVGTIYQASNACFLGRGTPQTLRVLPDGRTLSRRAISKLNTGDRGWRYAVEQLVAAGAGPLRDGEDRRAWGREAIAATTRPLRHPGGLKYAWTLQRRDRRHLPASLPYPKLDVSRAAIPRAA
jgi:hypothetical protein